jgi:raffinose/stachyose/melibiose transport system substrate-binding protein
VTGGPLAAGWAISGEVQKDPAKAEEIDNFIQYFFSQDVYTDFLAKSNFLSSLKEKYTYPASEQFEEVMRIAATADNKQLGWNQKLGPNELLPNFRNFCYKLVSEWFLNVSTIDAGLKTMDQEWVNATKDFNPVKNP